MVELLNHVIGDPTLHKWLQNKEQDTTVSQEHVSAAFRYAVVPGTTAQYPTMIPSTEPGEAFSDSLLIPNYRSGHYVMGTLFGKWSPNLMSLQLLNSAGFGPVPESKARRFVLNLDCSQVLEFVEYEWLDDGKLVISAHRFDEEGRYCGTCVAFQCAPSYVGDMQVPLTEVMKVTYREVLDCEFCSQRRVRCECPPTFHTRRRRRRRRNNAELSWHNWVDSFIDARNSGGKVTTTFEIFGPGQSFTGQQTFAIFNHSAYGISSNLSSPADLLRRQYVAENGYGDHNPRVDAAISSELERDVCFQELDVLERQEAAAGPEVAATPAQNVDNRNVLANGIMPQANGIVPQANGIVPQANGVAEHVAISGEIQPHSEEIQPRLEEIQPRLEEIQPRLEEIQPRLEEIQPRLEEIQPRLEEIQPSLEEIQPSLEEIQPRLSEIQLSSEEIQPSPVGSWQSCAGAQADQTGVERRLRNPPQISGNVITCGVCGTPFTHKGHYNEHYNTVHLKLKPNRCNFPNCPASFAKKCDLHRHRLAIHRMRRQYDCSAPGCSRSFDEKSSLHDHMRSEHGDLKPFVCEACDMPYATRSGLAKHLRNKHPGTRA